MIDSYEKYRQVAKYAGGYFEEQFLELINRLEETAKERDALRAELAQLHKEADKFGDGIDWIQRALQAEAQIEQMEKQEPVAEVVEDDFSKQVVAVGHWYSLPNGTKLYPRVERSECNL